jgi:squalene-hopene/tetraprenyl-beta-curcumene cyclase
MKFSYWRLMAGLAYLAVAMGSLQPCFAGDLSPEVRKTYDQTVAKGFAFLTTKGRGADGSFSSFAGPGMTALVTTAFLRHGRSPDHPVVANGLAYLQGYVQDDGGIYQPGSLYRNYETCLAIMCFQEANRDGRYNGLVQGADAFVKGIQWDESEGHDPSSLAYGGSGYGKHKRPDLSNTSYLVDALRAAGNDADSEAMQRALQFVSRCQNLETSHNQTAYAAKNPDGGFYYTIAAGGSSQAGGTAAGGLRSYGSMTYAGLKSMIFAGVGPDDTRVKAATKWIGKNYTLKTNPGLGDSGLYYYYHTFAKALSSMEVDKLVDSEGVAHDWRAELIQELARRQLKDGSWINENDRWLEGDPNLVSAYALLALSYCRPTDD